MKYGIRKSNTKNPVIQRETTSENIFMTSGNVGTHLSPSRGAVIFSNGKELNEQGLKKYALVFLSLSILLIIIGIFTMPFGILFIIAATVALIISSNYKRHRTDLLKLMENYTLDEDYHPEPPNYRNDFSSINDGNRYHENIEREHQNNSTITESDITPFKNKPFSLSGELMFDCGIPYFHPSDTDKKVIEKDIDYLINQAINTGIFKTYKIGEYVEYVQIRTQIYTPTRKIKKFPISVHLNDGVTFFTLYYNQNGKLGKAELTYTPNLTTGYIIKCKEINGNLKVRRICSYSIGGGPTSEIYNIARK